MQKAAAAYIEAISERLTWRDRGRVAAVSSGVLLVLTDVLAWAFVQWVPGSSAVLVARVVLFALCRYSTIVVVPLTSIVVL